MNEKTIDIELKPVIFAHHGGYRVIAQCETIDKHIIELLSSSKHHLYFTERKQDEAFKPLKFRFFTLKAKTTDQSDLCYVLGRIEPKHDVITHRGLVSAAQFYIIDGEQKQIFENDLQSNAAYLMAEIQFFNFDLTKLVPKEIVKIPPVKLSIKSEVFEQEVKNLYNDQIIKDLQRLFDKGIINKIDEGESLFIHSKRFTEAVDIFNIFCRKFFSAQIAYYRKTLSFTTSEFTANLKDYKLVFLHAATDINNYTKKTGINLVSLEDTISSSEGVFWYLNESELWKHHRFLSERVTEKNYATIQKLRPYCDFWIKLHPDTLSNLNSEAKIRDFTDIVKEKDFQDILKFLDAEKIGNDFAIVFKQYNNTWTTDLIEYYQIIFLVWYKITTATNNYECWSRLLKDEFNEYVIKWLELIVHSNDQIPIVSAIENLTICNNIYVYNILKLMLSKSVGLAVQLEAKKRIQYPEEMFKAWLTLIESYNEQMDDNEVVEVWNQVNSIINRIDIHVKAEKNYSEILIRLCLKIDELLKDQAESKELLKRMLKLLLAIKLFASWFNLLVYFIKKHGTFNEVYYLLEEKYYPEISDDAVKESSKKIFELFHDEKEQFVYRNVNIVSKLSLKRISLQDFITDLYVFTGKHYLKNLRTHVALLQEVKEGVKIHEIYNAFKNEIKMQEELLKNLSIISFPLQRVLNVDVDKNLMSIAAPEFQEHFSFLSINFQKSFYKNLFGFINYIELTDRIIPVLWSYMQMTKSSFYDYDIYFEKMIMYARNQIIDLCKRNRSLKKSIYSLLYRSIENLTPQKTTIDEEDCLIQIAAATKNEEKLISKFINGFLEYIFNFDKDIVLQFINILYKRYLSKNLTDLEQYTWKRQVETYEKRKGSR